MVVEQDPLENSRRAVLNLGHTVGHGLERLSAYRLRHGEAVAIGIVAATRIAVAMGLAAPDLIDRIEAALRSWGLPVRCPAVPFPALWDAMGHDKKRRGRSLRWVLPRAIGEAAIDHEVPREIVRDVLIEMGAVDRTANDSQEVMP
jgi:3-dehydroquinate synthetase